MSEWHRNDPLNRDVTGGRASALRRAIGLGSAKSGAGHWWLQRITAVALVPLTLWFMAGLIGHAWNGPAAVSAWLAQPLVALPTILLVVVLFQHTRLGLQVVIEDYVHADRPKFALVAATHAGCYGLMAVGIFSVLVIVFR
jgi:succinate dehydrogenase / fumarate reductase membrane anchor subunit